MIPRKLSALRSRSSSTPSPAWSPPLPCALYSNRDFHVMYVLDPELAFGHIPGVRVCPKLGQLPWRLMISEQGARAGGRGRSSSGETTCLLIPTREQLRRPRPARRSSSHSSGEQQWLWTNGCGRMVVNIGCEQ